MLSARLLAVVVAAAASLTAMTASAQDEPVGAPAPAAAPKSPAAIGLAPLPSSSNATIPVPAWPRGSHPDDVVVMNDGGMARGVVIEMLPKVQVSVRLSDGRTMIIPWDRVHHVEQGTSPATPAAPAPAPVVSVPAAPTASARVTGTANVHLDGAGAKLERERAGQWVAVCSAPCDQSLALDAFYRIGGDGIRSSKPFRLLAKDGDRLTITADVSTTTAFGVGITLASVGAAVGTISYYGLLLASAHGSGYSRHSNDAAVGGFALAMLGSAGIGTIGLVMTIANEKSGVKQSIGGASAGTASVSPAKMRASEPDRIPSWTSMGSAAPEHRGTPMALTVPLLGGRF
jgi:hypothetical protein